MKRWLALESGVEHQPFWLATVSIGKMAAANGSAMKFRTSHEKM
ncbi:hypothetical protein [Bradyrhizobium barranii]|nr:hypothetical protein [Bradyrhizobium barranii]